MSITANSAAIDAGSNAIRLTIARVSAGARVQVLKKVRVPVRLGHSVFLNHKFDEETIEEAVRAFSQFRELFDHYHIKTYRAVTTSAAREASNRLELVDRIYGETGIRLEVIHGSEEARLTRQAVLTRLGPSRSPDMILDLGGGSLEINALEHGELKTCLTLPVGTVRLMEMLGISGGFKQGQADQVRDRLMKLLHRHLHRSSFLSGARPGFLCVGSGGNAETLAELAPASKLEGMDVLDFGVLRKKMDTILKLGVAGRIKAFDVRKDRAEVMGVAAVIFTTLSQWFGMETMLVPGVGVREGVLLDLAAAHARGAGHSHSHGHAPGPVKAGETKGEGKGRAPRRSIVAG